jgi:RimJ/RimL family protein N-acetyltransferase
MHKMLLDLPTRLETARLLLRCYQPGDGPWYYAMGLRNQAHLARYETGNPARTLHTPEEAEVLMREFAAAWVARERFFLGAFDRRTETFVAQIYIGPVNWELPEFELGYFADVAHEGQGYVTEAARAALGFIFTHLHAHRVRLGCNDTNTRSYGVAERCGMVREGHLRENKRHADGSLSGTLYYGLLRAEFERERR